MLKALKELKDLEVPQESLELLEHKELKVRKELKDFLELKVFLELKELKAHKVVQDQ